MRRAPSQTASERPREVSSPSIRVYRYEAVSKNNSEHRFSQQLCSCNFCVHVLRSAGALGAGGMGEVYRARYKAKAGSGGKSPSGVVASDADRLLRFEQEERAVGALSHPNILMVHDIGDGQHRSRVQRVQRLGGHLRTRDITPIERLSHRSVPGLRRVHQTLDPPYLLQLSPLQSPSQGGDEQTSS